MKRGSRHREDVRQEREQGDEEPTLPSLTPTHYFVGEVL